MSLLFKDQRGKEVDKSILELSYDPIISSPGHANYLGEMIFFFLSLH